MNNSDESDKLRARHRKAVGLSDAYRNRKQSKQKRKTAPSVVHAFLSEYEESWMDSLEDLEGTIESGNALMFLIKDRLQENPNYIPTLKEAGDWEMYLSNILIQNPLKGLKEQVKLIRTPKTNKTRRLSTTAPRHWPFP